VVLAKANRIVTLISSIFVFLFLWINISEISIIQKFRNVLESPFIESRVIVNQQPWDKNKSNVVIIDIDQASLEQLGPWPWTGDKLQLLTNKIINSGASIIVFDLVFNKKSRNSATEVIQYYSKFKNKNSLLIKLLTGMLEKFDYDSQFATQLANHDVITGFLYHQKEVASSGYLPPSIAMKNKIQLRSITKANNFSGNIKAIQKASAFGGFINITPDKDGIFRRTPLIIQYGYNLYPSLALQTARVQQLTKKLRITYDEYNADNLKAIYIDEVKVPVESDLRVMLTYRGPKGSFPSFSAIDLINENFNLNKLRNKIVIVGSSEQHIRPLVKTLVGNNFSTAEIHANLISGILSNQLFTQPQWAKTIDNFLIAIIGLSLAIFLPFLNLKKIAATIIATATLWLLYNYLMFSSSLLINCISVPLLMILVIAITNIIAKHDQLRFRIISVIAHLQNNFLLRSKLAEKDNLQNTTIEETVTIMIVDIRNFTNLSDTLSTNQLNRLLNIAIAPITNIIEHHQGNIGQYIGHKLVASWRVGQAIDAIQAAQEIIATCRKLKSKLKQKNLPALQVNIGINTGKVRFKTLSLNSTIIYGRTVNTAAKLADLTQFYQLNCLVGEQTTEECKEYSFREIDTYTLAKGQAEIKIYEPIQNTNELNLLQYYEIEHYNKALDFIDKNKFTAAREIFQYLLKLNPNRLIYQLYFKRIEQLKKNSITETLQLGPLNRRK